VGLGSGDETGAVGDGVGRGVGDGLTVGGLTADEVLGFGISTAVFVAVAIPPAVHPPRSAAATIPAARRTRKRITWSG
jgi:hypothetical protein